MIAEVIREVRPAIGPKAWELNKRELRLELYAERWDTALSLVKSDSATILREVCRPFDTAWVARFPAELRRMALKEILECSLALLEPADEAFAMFEGEPEMSNSELRVFVEQLLFRGRLDDAEKRLQIQEEASLELDTSRAFVLFLRGCFPEAIAAYETALKAYLKRAGKRAVFFPDRAGFFFVLALLAEGNPSNLKRAKEIVDAANANNLPFSRTHLKLSELLEVMKGLRDPEDLIFLLSDRYCSSQDPLETLVQAAAILWAKIEKNKRPYIVHMEMEKRLANAEAAGYQWYAAQAASVLADYTGQTNSKTAPDSKTFGISLARLVAPRERWPEALNALLEVASPKTIKKVAANTPAPNANCRLAWILCKDYGIALVPREQTNTKGVWSKGRPVALKRLYEEAQTLHFLSDADRAACATIQTETSYEYYSRYARINYFLDNERALLALAKSCTVLMEANGDYIPCEIRQAVPQIEVTKKGNQFTISLDPTPESDEVLFARMSGAHSVEVIEYSPIHHAIVRAIGKRPLAVPNAGEALLRTVLAALSGRVAVHSDLSTSGDENEDTEAIRGETRPCFLLRALGDGLAVSAYARPLREEGTLVRPGRGGKTLLTQVHGRTARAIRDLNEETRRLESVIAACPKLAASQSETSEADFALRSQEEALGALLELRALGNAVMLEWPDGEVLQVTNAVGLENLTLSISPARRQNSWHKAP